MVASLGLAIVLLVAISDIVDGRMRPESLIAFIGAMLMVMAPLKRLSNVGGALQQGIAAGASVFEVLDEPRESQGGTLQLARARGSVEYEAVDFAYPGACGACTARTSASRWNRVSSSPSSAGPVAASPPSSDLLPRLHDVTQGAVRIDGSGHPRICGWQICAVR